VNKSRKVRWAGHVTCTGRIRRACKCLLGTPYRKRKVGKLRHRWKGNTKMDIRGIRVLTEFNWLKIEISSVFFNTKQSSSFIKGRNFLIT
jgi:hypothetical protein